MLNNKCFIYIQSLNDSYIPDAYDELLTQAEIQGHINNVNSMYRYYNIKLIIIV